MVADDQGGWHQSNVKPSRHRTGSKDSAHTGAPGYSILAPEAATIFPVLVHSAATYDASSSGVLEETSMPSLANASRTSGVARTLATSALSRPTISAGVPRGASRAVQISIS